MTGVPADIASIMTSPNGSGQSIGNRSARAFPRKLHFSCSLTSPMNSTSGWSSSGLITSSKYVLVGLVDLRGDLERNSGALRDLDGPIGPLLRRNPAQKREVITPLWMKRAHRRGQAMIDGREPVHMRRHGASLVVGDRDQRHVRKSVVDRPEVREIEPAVQGCHAFVGQILEQHMLEQVDVEVDHVELIGPPADGVEHHKVAGDVVADAGEPQALRNTRHKLRRGFRVATGEERDVVPLCHEFLGEIGHHPFRAAVELGGTASANGATWAIRTRASSSDPSTVARLLALRGRAHWSTASALGLRAYGNARITCA